MMMTASNSEERDKLLEEARKAREAADAAAARAAVLRYFHPCVEESVAQEWSAPCMHLLLLHPRDE